MAIAFVNSFRSEWLKKKRTAASWLVITGGFFIPAILLAGRLMNQNSLAASLQSPHFWEELHRDCWQFMAIFLLPMGVILAASLITQLEYRNNTWKQLHTSPQSFTIIFISKLMLILVMMIQFFVLFTIGIYLAGILPSLLSGMALPSEPFPFGKILMSSVNFFVCCLPIIAFQYLLGLQFRNFLVPLGAGIGLLVASLIAVQWKYGYTVPYIYCMLEFFGKEMIPPGINIHYLAWAYFGMFTIISYILYIRKKVKG